MIEEGLRTLLLAESTVTDLVTDDAGELRGVYVNSVPQGANLPYVLLTTLSDDHNNTLAGGDGSGAAALHTADVDIDCKAANPGAAKGLAAAVDAYLDDFSGTAGSETVEASNRNGRISSTESPTRGEGHDIHVETLDYQFQYRP